MQTIDLECPSCAEMLELDAGFAGGVCRCSNCGTLMTVPSDAGQAETLSRPGASGSSSATSPPPRRSSTKKRAGSKRSKSKASQGKRLEEVVEPGEYRTASGKVVRLDESVRVPMAQGKRKQIQLATGLVFFGIVGFFVLLAVVAILLMMRNPAGGGSGGFGGSAVQYDPVANPYDLEVANVAGLPLDGKVAVVIEASQYSEAWMPQVADLIKDGLAKPSKGVDLALIAGTQNGENSFESGTPTPASGLDIGKLKRWFSGLPLEGEADMDAAIDWALKSELDMLILVVGGAESQEVASWDRMIAAKRGLMVHVVLVDGSSLSVQGWMGDRDGELVLVSARDIENWKEYAESSDD